MKSVPMRGSAGSLVRNTTRSVMKSVPMRGSAGSLVRITTCSVMNSVPMRGSECLVVYLALILASVLTRRYRVTVLTS